MMKKSQLHLLLQPVQRRLTFIQCIRWGLTGLFAGLLIACLWLLIGRYYPIAHLKWSGTALILCGILAGILYAVSRRVTPREAARVMDRHGTNDAMTTALSFQNSDMMIARLQRQQAVEAAQVMLPHLKRTLPVPRHTRPLVASVMLAACFIFLLIWPNPMDDIIEEQAWQAAWVDEQIEEVSRMVEQLVQEDREDHYNLAQMLERLQADLKQSDSAIDALAAMDEMLHELELLKQQLLQSQQLEPGNDPSQLDLAEAGDIKDLQQLVERLQHNLAEMGAPMAEELTARGNEVSEGWQSDGLAMNVLQEAMLAHAGNVEDGSIAGGSNVQAGGTGHDDNGAGTGEGAGQEGNENGEGNGSGEGSAGGDIEGEGNGTGEGSGNGNGSGGEGNGGGSSEGIGSGQGAGEGSGAGLGEGSRNLVYTPRTMAGEGEKYFDPGTLDGGGGDMIHGGNSPVTEGTVRPYEEVFAQYEGQANEALSRSSLPYHTQQLVKQYFIDIQPNR